MCVGDFCARARCSHCLTLFSKSLSISGHQTILLASCFILVTTGWSSCSTSNTTLWPAGGTITRSSHRTHQSWTLSSSFCCWNGLRLTSEVVSHPNCTSLRTFESTESWSVDCLICLAITGDRYKFSINGMVSPASGTSLIASGRGKRLRTSALECCTLGYSTL